MGNKKTFQFLFMLVFMVGIIYVLYATFFGKDLDSKGSTNPNELALDTIVIEVQGGAFSFLKADISLEGVDKVNAKLLKANHEQIRRLLLNLSSQEDGGELLQDTYKKIFKKKIKNEINQRFGIKVGSVYFRNFVLAK